MSSSSFENNTDVNGCKKPQQQQHAEITIKVVSATYRPCEGLRLSTRALTNDETASIPISRDVAPFLRALLLAAQLRETKHRATDDVDAAAAMNNMCDDDPGEEGDDLLPHIVRVQPTVGGLTKSFIYLLGGGSKSMNAIFGDPCPGTSKRLHVHYVVTEAMVDDDIESRVAKTEVHHVNFAEHERVVLRRRLTFFQDDSQLTEAVKHTTSEREQTSRRLLQDSTASATIFQPTEMDSPEPLSSTRDIYEEMLRNARKMGRSQSIVELQQLTPESLSSFSSSLQPAHSTGCQEQLHRWRLRSAVSEIVLPIALPFLELRERVQCRRVCRSWKHVIRDWGVATTIDSNDQNITNFSRPFLRGVLSHSYSSLHSLFLSGFEILAKEDLHPAIPHLRKLRYLDVARCHTLDDSTMELLSQEVSQTLEVLYIKGLRNVTDVGLRAICQSCKLMEVLDISCVPITDEGGTAIAQLKRLRALFTRDNYHLTNRSIDVITESCTRLEQLTLWGCTRMQHLGFDNDAVNIKQKSAFNSGKLVVLNLWGCHSLKDEAAESLGCMKNLVSLIVSECHRLTDQFLVRMCM